MTKATNKGKITKPQKSSKHKKIKAVDPFYTGKRVVDRHAHEVNQPPKKGDDQDVPNNQMKELLHRTKQIAQQKLRREKLKKQRKNPATKGTKESVRRDNFKQVRMERGMSRPLKPAPNFQQHKNENTKSFLNRVERETQAVVNKSRFEDKFDVELVQKANGQTEIVKPVNEEKKAKQKERQQKKKEKKKPALEDKHPGMKKDFKELQDKVEFGEVAMAPPTLTAKPRNAPAVSRKASTMLLAREVGQTQKRKHMSMAQLVRLDDAQQLAIELYRQAKNKT